MLSVVSSFMKYRSFACKCILKNRVHWYFTACQLINRYDWYVGTDITKDLSTTEIIWNANLMQQGNFINVFLARRVSGTYARPSSGTSDVELQRMVFCTEFLDEWWSWEPLHRSCMGTANTTYAVALKTTTHLKTRCRKPYAATQHLMLLMMGVCTRNTSS